MVERCQNGYAVIERSGCANYGIPGTDIKIPLRKGDIGFVLQYVAIRFHREVEPLHPGWNWGHAVRLIRGSTTTASNHAGGAAEDLNAPDHPLGTDPARNYTSGQIRRIHAIINDCKVDGRPVIRWGGDYLGRKDGMHFEVIGRPADVHALADRIRDIGKEPTPPTKQGLAVRDWQALLEFAPNRRDGKFGPVTLQRSNWMRNAAIYGSRIQQGSRKSTIMLIQRIVDVTATGRYNAATDAGITKWVKQAQEFLGFKGSQVDGIWGKDTDAAYQAFVRTNYKEA